MRVGFEAYWLQKAGNSVEEYEDAFAPAQFDPPDCAEFRCAVADGATETSFSGLWARILVESYVDQRLTQIKPEIVFELATRWRQAIDARTRHKPLPWYALEKLERGAFSSLIGLSIRADGGWRALCVGDSCLFHIRPHQPIRAFPYYQPEQFNNHPLLISTNDYVGLKPQRARGKWQDGDYFLLMTDALAHFFLSQRAFRAQFVRQSFDQGEFARLVEAARNDRICHNDDVTFLKIGPMFGEDQGGLA